MPGLTAVIVKGRAETLSQGQSHVSQNSIGVTLQYQIRLYCSSPLRAEVFHGWERPRPRCSGDSAPCKVWPWVRGLESSLPRHRAVLVMSEIAQPGEWCLSLMPSHESLVCGSVKLTCTAINNSSVMGCHWWLFGRFDSGVRVLMTVIEIRWKASVLGFFSDPCEDKFRHMSKQLCCVKPEGHKPWCLSSSTFWQLSLGEWRAYAWLLSAIPLQRDQPEPGTLESQRPPPQIPG